MAVAGIGRGFDGVRIHARTLVIHGGKVATQSEADLCADGALAEGGSVPQLMRDGGRNPRLNDLTSLGGWR
jgi:hypothetical protein